MESQGIFFCAKKLKIVVEKRKLCYGRNEDYRLAVQSLSVKGVMLCMLHILI